jgi:hypothetical protein
MYGRNQAIVQQGGVLRHKRDFELYSLLGQKARFREDDLSGPIR